MTRTLVKMVEGVDYDERQRLTMEALRNPVVGDRFHEMYSYWYYCVWREGNTVAMLHGIGPCQFDPENLKLWIGTVDDLVEKHTYGAHMPEVPTELLYGTSPEYLDTWLDGWLSYYGWDHS